MTGETSEDKMSNLPLLVEFLVYGAVALSLYAETGDPHVGTSWPVGLAIVGMLVAFGYERRYIRG